MSSRAAIPATRASVTRVGARARVDAHEHRRNGFGSRIATSSNMRSHKLVALSIVLTAAFATTRARAEGLRIETQEHGSWAASVAALQVDRDSQGKYLHVYVTDGNGRRLRCGTYTLSFDATARDAFELGACDSSSDTTVVLLTHRHELFDHNDSPPRPRAAGITATRIETGGASGRAEGGGGSEAWCQAAVQPYMNDLENGGRVALTPGRYALKPRQEGVDARPAGNGWVLTVRRGTSLSVDYEVTDTKRGEVVLRDKVTMHCASDGAQVAPTPDVVVAPPTQETTVIVGTDSSAHEAQSQDWKGHALGVSILGGASYLRTGGLLFANNGGVQDSGSLGVQDATAATFGLAVSYERPWLYTSLTGTGAFANENNRTLYHFGFSSVVAPAFHVGDTTLYLGPNVLLGVYELSGENTGGFQWNGRPSFSLGAATGVRLHVRNDKGTAAYVLGFEVVAPVAGDQPWLFAASLGFGSSE
jgi:hypothetical protein